MAAQHELVHPHGTAVGAGLPSRGSQPSRRALKSRGSHCKVRSLQAQGMGEKGLLKFPFLISLIPTSSNVAPFHKSTRMLLRFPQRRQCQSFVEMPAGAPAPSTSGSTRAVAAHCGGRGHHPAPAPAALAPPRRGRAGPGLSSSFLQAPVEPTEPGTALHERGDAQDTHAPCQAAPPHLLLPSCRASQKGNKN